MPRPRALATRLRARPLRGSVRAAAMTCSAWSIRSPAAGRPAARSSPRAPASSSQQPTDPHRHASSLPVSGMCPNSPAEPCAPVTGRPPTSRTPPMPVATCRCRATGTPRSTPRLASASPASVASLPARTGPHASDGPSAAVTSMSCHSVSVGWTMVLPRTGEGTAMPTPTTRSPNWRPRILSRPATSVSIPVPEPAPRSWRSRTVQRPVSSKAATVKESSRRSTASATGPSVCADGTPVGRPRARCTVASTGPASSSISRRPARSRTSTVAVPRARLSCLVSSARVSWPPPSWTARNSRARLWARSSALVVAAPSSFRTPTIVSRPFSCTRTLPVPVESDGGLLGQAQVPVHRELRVQGDGLAFHDGPVQPVPHRPFDLGRHLIRVELDADIEVLHEELHHPAELRRRGLAVMEAHPVFQRGCFPGGQWLGQEHIDHEEFGNGLVYRPGQPAESLPHLNGDGIRIRADRNTIDIVGDRFDHVDNTVPDRHSVRAEIMVVVQG